MIMQMYIRCENYPSFVSLTKGIFTTESKVNTSRTNRVPPTVQYQLISTTCTDSVHVLNSSDGRAKHPRNGKFPNRVRFTLRYFACRILEAAWWALTCHLVWITNRRNTVGYYVLFPRILSTPQPYLLLCHTAARGTIVQNFGRRCRWQGSH